jgi:hypothetical protein
MSEVIEEPIAPAPTPPGGDLSRDIERAVERLPHDRVRCVRVYADNYRCNWWAPPAAGAADPRAPVAPWALTAMHRVRQSSFLRATNHGGKLVIVARA